MGNVNFDKLFIYIPYDSIDDVINKTYQVKFLHALGKFLLQVEMEAHQFFRTQLLV